MDERTRRIERLFEIPVLVAALLVIPVIVIEESETGRSWQTAADVMNWASWLVFLAELVTLLSVVPDRRRWLREHAVEVAVVVLTPPFITALSPLRLLRLLVLLRLLRLAPAARRLFSVEGLRYAALLAVITAVAGGAAFAELEETRTPGEGIYWAITTMTTVGYGDVAPTTTGAKVLAIPVILVGIGFVAILTGAVAQRFFQAGVEEAEQEEDRSELELSSELRALGARLLQLEAVVRERESRP